MERVGVVGSEIGLSAGSGCGTTDLRSLNQTLLCKDKKNKGPTEASSVAVPMPKSVSL